MCHGLDQGRMKFAQSFGRLDGANSLANRLKVPPVTDDQLRLTFPDITKFQVFLNCLERAQD